jgi:DNA-binding NtrC family response regulator
MAALLDLAGRAADSGMPLLIQGDGGTGKELLARVIHARSPRAQRPLHIVTCATQAEQAIESQLFGHQRADGSSSPGVFEVADQATVFLDELTDLPSAVQARLIRLLEHGEVQRPGETVLHRIDVRLIAATSRDPSQVATLVRSELLHLVAGLTLALPPLRQRPGDIELLVEHFLAENATRLGQPLKRLATDTRTLLLRHPWPGNVRQLRQAIERACLLASERVIHPGDLPDNVRAADAPAAQTPLASLATIERAHILRVLEHCDGNKKAAAELLEIDRSTLYAKLKQYGVL